MATALDPALDKKPFINWLKGALAVLFAREGLTEFVQNEISGFQRDLLQSIFIQNAIPPGTTCSSCTTANVLKCPTQEFCGRKRPCKLHDPSVLNKTPNQRCSKNICHHIKDAIHKHHRFHGPTWEITDATRWCSDPFEIAKCYLPPKGYCNKTSLVEIDFNGTLGIIISNTRFQNKLAAQLNMATNICSKVRDMINEKVRHSASYELSDVELAQIIDALLDLLQDPKFLLHDQHAKDAVSKLNQLQNNTLIISAGDITKVLEENFRENITKQQQDALLDVKTYFDTLQTASVAALESIKSTVLDEILKTADDKNQELLQLSQQQQTHNDDVFLNEFKMELVRFYNEKESMIPASPLVEDHAVPLMKLYVQPPMSAFIKPNAYGQKSPEKTSVSSYRELFLNDDNVPYKNIYVEANAGYGKTSFTQKVAVTWCLAQNPPNLTISKDQQKDVDTLKRFDLLFLLHLRDFHGDDMCLLDDLIYKFVSKNLPSKERFSKEFIGRMLQNKTCLAILDGLDEWVHPETCPQTPGIPHNNYRERCTRLITTRPWKLSTIGLTPNLIDRHIEISTLDNKTSQDLKSNAFKLLSENSGEREPDLKDFDRKLSSVKIGDIRLIPYILLQLICIWFDGLSIGKSKCETYSNTIELTLQRGLKKKNAPTLPTGNAERNFTVQECMRHNVLCNQYMNLLLKVGKLAFYALFQKNKESSLVIDSTTVLKFLTQQELEFCLKIGLLSQSKDRSKVSVKRYQVFFQHKSIQEFMAALYIVSEWNNGTIKSTILEDCSSLSSILEMENLFVFVCGINPEVYTCISGELQTIVDLDDVTRRYRTYMDSDYDAERAMKSYQSMQVQCLQESVRNGNDSCSIHLHDYILTEEDLTSLKIIINFNKGNVKSLQLSDPDQITEFMQSLDPGVFTSLETLRVELCDKEPVWLADILTESARTLKCLTLSGYGGISLSDISITALTGLTCLQSLYLDDVHMTHSNVKCLYAYISQTTTLTQLKLVEIRCSDHSGQYRDCDVTLDLHRLNVLKMLHLEYVPCRELHVNPACLEKLEFCPPFLAEKMTARASATLWQDLRAAPVISSLTLYKMTSCQEMIQTISTLTQLQHLELGYIDMGDVIPRFSFAMTQLEHVVLREVTMSSAAWQTLFLSIGQLPRSITVKLSWITMTSQKWRELLLSVGGLQHPVTVELEECEGPSEEEWRTIVNVFKTTPTLSLLQDLSIDDGRWASLTLKNKTEYGFADLTLSSGMWSDKSLTQNKEFRTVQANQQQRTGRVERYEPEEGAYKIHESAQAKQGPSVEMYEPEKLESECTLMSSDLLSETENQPVCHIGGSFTTLNVYFRSINNQVPRHLFSPEMLDAFSSLLKRNTHLECVILNEMKMGDKELEIVKLSKKDIEQISKYEKGKTNIVQLCTETIGRQILLLHGTQFDLQDFLIELNSNIQHTFADSVILNLVCFNLVKCNIEIKEAYPSMLGADTLPSLVCILDKNIHLSTFRGFLLKKRIIDDFVNESCKLENSIEKESDEYKRVLKQNFEDINVTHAEHSRNLLSKHSNIEAISVSFVKMSGNGAVQICPCIVIYCKFKSAVPYKEDPFPRALSHPLKDISFQTDVREGYFSLCPYFAQGSKEWNRELAMGCSIGEKNNKDNATTIGPFVDVIETHETCFLTVRHLFLPITRRDDQLEGLKVVQPADCDLPPVQHNQMPERECGKVIASVFNEDIDAALIKVAEERKPARGHFVTVTREELRKAGLSQAHIPTFDNGDMLKAAGLDIVDKASRPLLKIGSRTGLTTGQLCTIDGVVKLTNDPLAFDFGYNGISQPHYFRKQLLLRSFHNQPFCLPGDSGSAVFLLDSDLRLKCIGIVIGIFSDYQAVVTPIEHILDILGRKYGNRTLQLKQFNLNEMEIE